MTDVQQQTCAFDAQENKSIRLALLSGAGDLPVRVAKNAIDQAFTLFAYTMDKSNLRDFRRLLPENQVRFIRPGMLDRNMQLLKSDGITSVVFAGKVNKWILLKSPLLDGRAIKLWQQQKHFNDDALMLALIRELENENITVLRQTDFMQGLLVPPGVYTQRQPSDLEKSDIQFGLNLAREMGRLDVGQTVVVHNGMVLAVEAIEGTDQAILRAGRWKKTKGGVVAKSEKPGQDLRFDVPTVGIRTLKTMRKSGLSVLAIEANKTITLELDKMIALANRWQMTIIAV